MLGVHLELGRYRTEFLKSHGIGVIFPETQASAFAAIPKGGFDVVILSYSLSNQTARELVELLEQSHPNCPIIAITEKRWHDQELRPDATVLASDPPQSLLEAINRVGGRRSGIRRIK